MLQKKLLVAWRGIWKDAVILKALEKIEKVSEMVQGKVLQKRRMVAGMEPGMKVMVAGKV